MTLKPIDMKTTLSANDNASRLREAQKLHEQGQSVQTSQNQEKDRQKVETIQGTQQTEHKKIDKQDEDAEKEGRSPEKKPGTKNKPSSESETEEPERPQVIPDGLRGQKIDLKA